MSLGAEEELRANGCMNPEWFLRDHIPRYANHYGVGFVAAYQAVLGEHVALTEVRNENFRQMLDSGFAHKMLQIFAKRGQLHLVGERPLIVKDNYIHMMKRDNPDDPFSDFTYYDPLNPLAISNFTTMEDPIPAQCADAIAIGRPNSEGDLWLINGVTVGDYDVVRDCFNRLLALRVNGITPHILPHLDMIHIPYTLGHPERPYDPNHIQHDPVDYTGFTTELKVKP